MHLGFRHHQMNNNNTTAAEAIAVIAIGNVRHEQQLILDEKFFMYIDFMVLLLSENNANAVRLDLQRLRSLFVTQFPNDAVPDHYTLPTYTDFIETAQPRRGFFWCFCSFCENTTNIAYYQTFAYMPYVRSYARAVNYIGSL